MSPVRIENKQKIGTVGARGAGRSAGTGPAFRVDDGASPARPGAVVGAAAAASMDVLLALQSADDLAAFRRKKQVRRAAFLLDALEDMKADLLVGRASEGRLNELVTLIGQARDRSDPRLDALIDDIELRVHVELAKRGIW